MTSLLKRLREALHRREPGGRRSVDLPIVFEGQTRDAVETLEVDEVARGRYRLLYSPGMVEGMAAGDEFELTSANRYGFRVLSRAKNLAVWFFFPEAGQNRGPAAEALRREIEKLGGWLDGGGHTTLVFTLPVSAGFPAVERVMAEALRAHAGTRWMFGNVYALEDGTTPLNWWL